MRFSYCYYDNSAITGLSLKTEGELYEIIENKTRYYDTVLFYSLENNRSSYVCDFHMASLSTNVFYLPESSIGNAGKLTTLQTTLFFGGDISYYNFGSIICAPNLSVVLIYAEQERYYFTKFIVSGNETGYYFSSSEADGYYIVIKYSTAAQQATWERVNGDVPND